MKKISRRQFLKVTAFTGAAGLLCSCSSTPVGATSLLPSKTVKAAAADGRIDLTGLEEYNGVKLATGADITKADLLSLKKLFTRINIESYGAVALEDRAAGDTSTHAIKNTEAINQAIQAAHDKGGATVVVPKGTFRVYTIRLLSDVNIYLSKGAVLQAAKTTIVGRNGTTEAEDYYEDGTPGNYDQPEVNIYAGLQDGGHTYFANSLFYAADKQNIMIYGDGLIDGSQMNDEGTLDQVLQGNDPGNPANRTGRITTWYGNKGISLVRCEGVVLTGIRMLNCGHFAIISEGSKNLLVDDVVIDTNRDAFNIDCTQDVTIQDSWFNSLTDDAIVFKASYGAGIFQPVQNCIVKNCTVSGYDAGSVLAETYTSDKQVATDACGPTARIKFGTESTCGYNTVTISDVTFQRSRGFCLESVDGSAIHDIIMVNAKMDTISSSPVFIRLGNRGRYPVTGNSTLDPVSPKENVRLTNAGWVLPLNGGSTGCTWTEYPIQRYFPAYDTSNSVVMSNGVKVSTVHPTAPTRLNPNNYYYDEAADAYYEYAWDEASHAYVVSGVRIDEADLCCYGDAVGFAELASGYNICVSNVQVTNVDPRYPITLAGLVDSKIRNVTFENIRVTYRGGIRMQDAVEQQQLGSKWEYTQYMTAPTTQNIPWLVNTFFCKLGALLPRVDWDAAANRWVDDPYNVPEMPEQYPEPSNFGILPAYGLYARHVDGLHLKNVTFKFEVDDERHAVVLDDCQNVDFEGFEGQTLAGVPGIALVAHNYKRHTGFEYVLEEDYFSTDCENIGDAGCEVCAVAVNAPEPSTPADSKYPHGTIACPDTGYAYGENVWTYNGLSFTLPVTVHRPFFAPIGAQTVKAGNTVSFTVSARNPAVETGGVKDQAAADASLRYYAEDLPEGAVFDAASRTFTWTPAKRGSYEVRLCATDGVLPVAATVAITVR